jgi:hypothetical protein
MPWRADEVWIDLICGREPDGRPCGWYRVWVLADSLRRLGLHPDQPTSTVTGPSPPPWWHAEAERHLR